MKPEKLFGEIAQFVTESRALLESGAMMELAGLDERVKILCDAVLQLSQDERLRYADQLQQLLGDLKELGEAMAVQRDTVADEIRHLSQHKKAHTAYRVADTRDSTEEE